jgi:hypothetical protein
MKLGRRRHARIDVVADWSPGDLAPGIPYRVFFHVYDGTSTGLVVYDKRDLICGHEDAARADRRWTSSERGQR